jgi:ATP phosphoribosyltransferase regulatory subunit
VLFDEAAERRTLGDGVERAFSAWGYRSVETPVVERFRTLEAGAGASIEGTVFTVVDSDGSLLALRPEMTVPIARLAATRLDPDDMPHRISYVTDVFREQATLRGQARQFQQAGVELVGAAGPAADAEVVAVLVAALESAGLARFTVALGSVAVLRALLAASGMPDGWQRDAMNAAHRKDLVRLGELAGADGVDARTAAAMIALLKLRGGPEAIDSCRELVGEAGKAALDDLAATVGLLAAAGVADRLVVDFGVLRDFDYYTGFVVEAYAPGLGLPLGGGGRYDGVLATLGEPAPAAGFALGIERLHIAAKEQACLPGVRGVDALLGGAEATDIFRAAATLRAAGWRVALAPTLTRAELPAAALSRDIRSALWAEGASLGVCGPSGTIDYALDLTDLPAPPTTGGSR